MNISERGNLTVGSPGKKLIAFAVPIIIINLMQAVYNVADMVIIGHFVGAAGMSAVSIGGQITTVVLVVIVAIANGAAAIIGQSAKLSASEKFMGAPSPSIRRQRRGLPSLYQLRRAVASRDQTGSKTMANAPTSACLWKKRARSQVTTPWRGSCTVTVFRS